MAVRLYKTIVADPPWQLKIGETRTSRGPVKRGKWNDPRQDNSKIHAIAYPQMMVDEIAALSVPAERDAHCYIWTINRHVESAFHVMRSWGFKPVTLMVWCKAPMGLGLGGTFVNTAEYILFGRRGNLPAKCRVDRNWWQWKRGKHSVKPEEFQDIVEQVSQGPYLEMFARRKRSGWDSWGNEVTSDVELVNKGGESWL
jgi:N6-adenosine-specific RNA methylase IME4